MFSKIRRPINGMVVYYTIDFEVDNEDTRTEVEEVFQAVIQDEAFLKAFNETYTEWYGDPGPVENFSIEWNHIMLVREEDDA